MKAGRLTAVCALLLMHLGPAAAMTVGRLDVGERGRGYFVEFEASLDAPPEAVMAVLQDYNRYPDLDGRILEARIVGRDGGRPLLYTRLRGCVGSVFCRDMERYERLTETASRVVAEVVPGRGDLDSGHTETRVEPEGTGSRVSYRTQFVPSFWTPRWLVRQAMRKTLEQATHSMFTRVESRAQQAAPP